MVGPKDDTEYGFNFKLKFLVSYVITTQGVNTTI